MAGTGLVVNPFFYSIVLPFILVFVVVYAILEKTNILGENKRNVNLLVGFCIAFIFIGVPAMVNITLKVIPVVSLIVVLLLCFLLLFGFIGVDTKKSKILNIILGVILAIALLGTILWATGAFQLASLFSVSSNTIGYVVFIVVFIIVILAVLAGGKKSGGD